MGKGISKSPKFIFVSFMMAGLFSNSVFAGDDIPNYPFNGYYNGQNVVQPDVHGSMVEEFDWQDEWGGIHMNTFTDGIRDPGEPGSGPDSIVPCSQGVICSDSQVTDAVGTMPPSSISADVIYNGIKYDFKNSFLNCASRPSPNFPSGNGGWDHPFSKFVCNVADPAIPAPDYTSSDERHGKATLIYSPLYDPRSNDERANGKDRKGAGCIQQIANSCINDIHECALHDKTDPNPAYYYPTSHVFRPGEIAQLEATGMVGKKLPRKYYEYTKNDDSLALSATKDNYPDKKDGTDVVEIDTYNDKLARIRTFRLENLGEAEADITGFIVADPSNFFNLRHYMPGGSMAAGFGDHGRLDDQAQAGKDASGRELSLDEIKKSSMFDDDDNPLTYDTCPIIGIGGYGGICDPKPFDHPQWAGCNLPIYGIGNSPEISIGTETFTDRENPVIWSGYVKKWAFISKLQYLENIKERRGANGGILYAGQTDLNTEKPFIADEDSEFKTLHGYQVDPRTPDVKNSPILMVERAPEYCDQEREVFKERAKPGQDPELPCIHYFQYQELDLLDNTKKWTFVNLFQPKYDGDFSTKFGYAYLNLFHEVEYPAVADDGTAILNDDGSPVIKREPYIYDKFNTKGNGPKQLMPIACNEGYAAGAGGTCYDSGAGANDRDYLDEAMMVDMGLDYGFDETKNYVTFMDAKVSKRKLIKVDEFGEVTEVWGPAESALVMKNYCENGVDEGCDEDNGGAPLNTNGDIAIGNHVGKDANGNPIKRSGTSLELPVGKVLAIRMPDPNAGKAPASEGGAERISTRCAIAMNKDMDPTSSKYFVPTNTQAELDSFVNSNVENIEFRKCKSEFLTYDKSEQSKTNPPTADGKNPENGTKSWFGQVKCSQLTDQPTCNNTKIITAQRYCILEDGKHGNCQECMDAANAGIDDGNILASRAGDGKDDLMNLEAKMNDEIGGIVMSVAINDKDTTSENAGCYFSALCILQDAAGCPSAATSGGHVFCLSADTKIDMADGSKKEIAKIKDGESVMAFTSKGAKSKLIKAKVVATTITRDQDYLIVKTRAPGGKYTTLNITPEHKMILPIGRAVMVKDLKVGVPIVDANGKTQYIVSIEEAKKRIDVHNLILEDGAEGYIAEGIRVQSYPLQSELKQMMSAK